MVLAVRAAKLGASRGAIVFFLTLTLLLGLSFVGIHFYEYSKDYHEQHVPGLNFRYEGHLHDQVEVFFFQYFVMTLLHMLHLVIGIALMGVITVLAWRDWFSPEYHTPLELAGLYWHFVDIVWVFLFPLLYLVSRS